VDYGKFRKVYNFVVDGFINQQRLMIFMTELVISGHPDEWVALIGKKVVAANKSFNGLVKQLEAEKLLGKVTVTRVNGNRMIL
jgi:hypothetical protein